MRATNGKKGIIWKYLADSSDPNLKDEMGKIGCRVANPDPDFWEHTFPLWAICGPLVRTTLSPGDRLFYTPTLSRSRSAGMPDYVCTGYLTVSEILPNPEALMKDSRISERYKLNYQDDLDKHLIGDTPRTRQVRGKNIVVGNARHSSWFGKAGPQLTRVVRSIGMGDLNLYARRIRNLDSSETDKLHSALERQR